MMRRRLMQIVAFAGALFASQAAFAQNSFETPAGSRVNGTVAMCLDAQGKAVATNQAGACPGGGGGGGGLSVVDQAVWTQGTSAFTPGGGIFNDTATLSSGQQGTYRLTTKRAQVVDVDTSGNALYSALTAPIAAGTNSIGNVGTLAYPIGATAITASATGTTGATTATLAGAAAKTTYICSLSVRANATANTNVTNTVTGVITGTLSRAMWIPANTAGLGVDEQIYNPCVPASGTNQAIAVVSGAPGTGGVVTVNATGYQL